MADAKITEFTTFTDTELGALAYLAGAIPGSPASNRKLQIKQGFFTPQLGIPSSGEPTGVVLAAGTGGYFLRIGSLVLVKGNVRITNKGSSTGSYVTIRKLPYEVDQSGPYYLPDGVHGGFRVYGSAMTGLSGSLGGKAGYDPVTPTFDAIQVFQSSGTGNDLAISNANLVNACVIGFEGIYHTSIAF